MKKFFKYNFPIIVLLIFFANKSFSQGAPFCPSIVASGPPSPVCLAGCSTLTANVVPVNSTTNYSIQAIPYVPYAYTGGTPVSVGTDDIWSTVINLPYKFCYFGNTYTQCIIGSNGQICFNLGTAGGYDGWPVTTALPSLVDMPGNTICAAFRDIDPSFGGTVGYYFTGTAPCRALVIYWANIPLYSCGPPNSTFEAVLYENTNYIDIYLQSSSNSCVSWQQGKGIIGIQNAPATVAYCPPARNFPSNWTATNEAWRFVPTGIPSYTVDWTGPGGYIGSGLTQTVCPASTTGYTATMNVTSCSGVTSTYTSPVTVSVSPNPPPVITSTVSQFSCASPTANAGSINITSGTPGYTVNWSPVAAFSGSTANTWSVTGLTIGINTVMVIDAQGCSNTATVNVTGAPPVSSFSLSAPSGTVIGCNPPTLPLVATNTSTLGNMTFTWTSATTGTATGTNINATALGGTNTYTVYGNDLTAGACQAIQVITVTQNTTVPSVTVNPISGNITCNGAPACFTAVCSPTVNVQGQWLDPSLSPIGGLSNSPVLLCANQPGVYTASFTNITNGCSRTQTVSVTSSSVIPTMTINALNGYVITCNQPCLTMNISTSSTLAPKSYSWTNLSTTVTTTPPTGGYTICTPGNYLAEFMDGNFCRISQMITISIDTLRPSPSAISGLPSNSYTLNCYNACITPTAISNPLLSPGSYSWTTPPNLTVNSNTVSICLANISSSITATNYTVLAIGSNGCIGKAKIQFFKNIYVPPYTAVFTPSAITCANPCVAMSPQTTTSVAATFTFVSPAPTTTANTAGALFCVPGAYTMNYNNVSNGCQGTYTNINVQVNATPPATVVLPPIMLPCGSNTAVINSGLVSSVSCTFIWKGPLGSGLSNPNGYTTSVNMTGNYNVIITNTINGCTALNSVAVVPGTITANFTPNPSQGFSPLSVNFNNTSVLGSSSTGTVYTWWGYGNGSTNTYTNISAGGSPNGFAMYPTAGTYSVLLVVTQSVTVAGNTTGCTSTATALIVVDLPSKLIVPNIFTPNGDGINDVFFVQSTNLAEITCVIFDRWGVKMYDVSSTTGNISWDGKTLFGKDTPSGTYFYILKATGKDGNTFEEKGSLSLYR